ncbi:hypothetical protein [Rhizobium sp. BR 314]|uniref:hypothetical protein n=1 Tax=Rhizobium sp. BR 314 TaxID=3040013 RepID=UPI0039BF45D5
MDELLHGVSILEIGYLSGVLAYDAELLKVARHILELKEVQTYFREYYPLILPDLFLERTLGNRATMENADPYWFGRVLALDLTFEGGDMRYFLQMVDGFWIEGIDVEQLSIAFEDKERCLKAIATPKEDRTVLQKGIAGTEDFLFFCDDLIALRGATRDEALRTALVALYRYWFVVRKGWLLKVLLRARASFPRRRGDGMPTVAELRQLFSAAASVRLPDEAPLKAESFPSL